MYPNLNIDSMFFLGSMNLDVYAINLAMYSRNIKYVSKYIKKFTVKFCSKRNMDGIFTLFFIHIVCTPVLISFDNKCIE